MTRSYPQYNYDLAEELVQGMEEACGVDIAIQKVAVAVQDAASTGVFTVLEKALDRLGSETAHKCHELGAKYRDRTAEIIEEVVAKTGIAFPSLPQRYLEIAVICPRPQDKWTLYAANVRELTYSVTRCSLFTGLSDINPEVSSKMPCLSYCGKLAETIFKVLGIPVHSHVLATMAKDGYCRFQYLKK